MINYLSREAELMGLLAEGASLSPVNYIGKNVSEGRDGGSYRKKSELKSLSRVRLFVTSWTAYNAPPSMGFSRQEY